MTDEGTAAQEPAAHSEVQGNPTAHFVHAVVQFALAVRHRKNVVLVALVICGLLGGLYYLTATRYYMSTASLLILDVGSDPMAVTTTPRDSWQQTLLPNFQKLIASEKVIESALRQLRPQDLIDLKGTPRDKWVEAVQSNLSVKSHRKTSILEVSYRSKDPHAAAAMVDAIVDSYMDLMDEIYKTTADDIKEVLTSKEKELTERLSAKVTEQNRLRQQSGDLRIPGETKAVHPLVERAFTANNQLLETREHRIKLEIVLSGIEAAVSRGEDLASHLAGLEDVLGTDPAALLGLSHSGELLSKLQQKVIEYRAKREAMQGHYGPAWPEMVQLENEIRITEQCLLEYPAMVKRELTSRLGPELAAMVRQRLHQVQWLEASLEQEFDQASGLAIQINGQLAALEFVERDIDFLYKMRETMLNQIASADLRHEGQELRAQRIAEPAVDESPVSPRLAKTMLMVLLLGLGSGLGTVYVLDTLSDRFRSPEEMQALLRTPVLAMVPELKASGGAGMESLQAYAAPNAGESEAFRTLRTALSFADEETHQLVVSSPEPGDGKTTVLANLGVAIAQSGKRVLLIDADLRRPGLTAMLGMRGIEGLSSVIRGEEDLVGMAKNHIRSSEVEGLDVLPSGPRPANPAELLGSQRFSELLAWAEATYDQILVDSPPTLATSDAAVVGRLVNGAVLVVNPSKNRRRPVMRSVEGFALMKIPLVGLVVNRIDSTKDGYYGYGGYYGYQYTCHDETEEDLDGVRWGEEDDLGEEPPAYPSRHDSALEGGIIPRRVA